MEEPDMVVDLAASWEERYQRGEAGWDLGQAAPPLERWLTGADAPVAGQRVAVLGCGLGHDALLFARAGHIVTGFDFAYSAVRVARERAAAAGLNLCFEQADIFTLPDRYSGPDAAPPFDLVVEHTCFCAINPRRRADYVAVVHDLLAAGGTLVALFWAHRRTGGPPFGTSQQEIERLFTPSFSILSLDRPRDSVARRAQEELLVVMRKRPTRATAGAIPLPMPR